MGASLAGIALYFLVRWLRRRHQSDGVNTGTSTQDAEPILLLLGSERYEKPELTAEDARKELEGGKRRGAELAGSQTAMELEAPCQAGRHGDRKDIGYLFH